MSRYDYFDDYEYDQDTEYGRIATDSNNLKDVKTVSMLRHYINCWGFPKKLKEHLKPLTESQIEDIVRYCYGSITIKELKKGFDDVMDRIFKEYQEQEERKLNKIRLIEQLKEKRNNFCGIDTRNIKLILNKLGKTDPIALTYRYLLEAEDYNIKAKEAKGDYIEKNYKKKAEFINKVVELCKTNDFTYGIQESDVAGVTHIIYFDIPGCKQISFHTDIENSSDFPVYNGEWDGLINSTLLKLEEAIMTKYPEEINGKKNKLNK